MTIVGTAWLDGKSRRKQSAYRKRCGTVVPKTGTGVPKSRFSLSDAQFAELIAAALKAELGGSRRATKTIMAWTNVTDHTARAWLHGRKSPSSLHLLALAANCRPVMDIVLRLTGHDSVGIAINLDALEIELGETLRAVRALKERSVR